jgi:hypothetical protein
MGVYRRHSGGIWWNAQANLDEIWKRYGLQHLALYVEIGKLYDANPRYRAINDTHVEQMYDAIIRTDKKYGQDQLQRTIAAFPAVAETYLLEAIARREQAITDLQHHANEQAKIIAHYQEKAAQLEQQVKHPIKTAVKARLKR